MGSNDILDILEANHDTDDDPALDLDVIGEIEDYIAGLEARGYPAPSEDAIVHLYEFALIHKLTAE